MQKFKHVIDRHKPKGYTLKIRALTANDGMTQFRRDITIDSALEERAALFVFLHECGHVYYGHMSKTYQGDTVHAEYQADQYAIAAMKAEGVPIPRKQLENHKAVMRKYIEEAHGKGHSVDEEVLRYAYGKYWRAHK